jgi:hypothetical protein
MNAFVESGTRPTVASQPEKAVCDCGAAVWCYLCGYKVKPPSIERAKRLSRHSLEYKQAQMLRRESKVVRRGRRSA